MYDFSLGIDTNYCILQIMNTQSPPILERKPIGEVTRNGGISLVVSQAEKGIATLLYKQNEPVAIMLPCDRKREQLYTNTLILQTLVHVTHDKSSSGAISTFLETFIELGEVAREILRVLVMGDTSAAQDAFIAEVEKLQNNSSQESSTVPPTTTARGDVSEVKSGGLPNGNSPLFRKRGRPKKEVSPPQKR
jgi:hypothetical protein